MKALHKLFVAAAAVVTCCTSEANYPEEIGPFSPPAIKYNVYGVVTDSNGNPIPGVTVSDGYVVTITGDDGAYIFRSEKANGYVFISQPQGYEVMLDGVFPLFWQSLSDNTDSLERHDFTLMASDNEECVLLALGDLHLCNRNALGDKKQFRMQVEELKSMTQTLRSEGKKVYMLTLGDMTWDKFWDQSSGLQVCNFDLAKYKDEMSLDFSGCEVPIWQTIGNHDHDYTKTGDWDTVIPYKEILGPTYYSFNVGGWHIVVLDNIICKNGGTLSTISSSTGLTSDILDWLKADMATVDASVPVIVSMHAQAYNPKNPTGDISKLNYAASMIAAIGRTRNIHIVTGHTHCLRNAYVSSNVYEHNGAALCATWWWTGRLSTAWGGGKDLNDTYHVCKDGVPGGYTVYNLSSGAMEWYYKGFSLPLSKQFKTYDRNSFSLDAETWCPKAPQEAYRKAFLNMTSYGDGEYSYAGVADGKTVPENLVYINIWNWDINWKLSVKENGKELEVKPLTDAYDPMHLVAYPAARYNSGYDITGSYLTSKNQHMFRVQASDPSTTLVITATDSFGNTYTETMARPKVFAVNWD